LEESCRKGDSFTASLPEAGFLPGENRYVVNELGVGYRMADAQD